MVQVSLFFFFFFSVLQSSQMCHTEYENVLLAYRGICIYAPINLGYIPIFGNITILASICNITGMVTSHGVFLCKK